MTTDGRRFPIVNLSLFLIVIPSLAALGLGLYFTYRDSEASAPRPTTEWILEMEKFVNERLERPCSPPPGARFLGDFGEPLPESQTVKITGLGQNPPASRSGRITEGNGWSFGGLVLDLSRLRPQELVKAVRKILQNGDEGKEESDQQFLETLSGFPSFEALTGAARDNTGVAEELALATSIFYADRFSGLGFSLRTVSAWGTHDVSQISVVLLDSWGGYFVNVSTWVALNEARAYVQVDYHEHITNAPATHIVFDVPEWGTEPRAFSVHHQLTAR